MSPQKERGGVVTVSRSSAVAIPQAVEQARLLPSGCVLVGEYLAGVGDDGKGSHNGVAARDAVPAGAAGRAAGGVGRGAPGGPGLASGTLAGLGLDAATAGRHAGDSLAGGNLGRVALLDVLARTMTDGSAERPAMAVAYGPGFTAAALYLRAVRSGAAG